MFGNGGLDAGKGAGEIDSEDVIPPFPGDLHQRVEGFDSRAGDHDEHRAELSTHPGEGVVHRRPIRHVGLDGQDLGPTGSELAGRVGGRRAVAINDGDGVAIGDALMGDAQSDPRGSPGTTATRPLMALPSAG